MAFDYTVLGSGSKGNASMITIGGAGVLIDPGFGPRNLRDRLAQVGASWEMVRGAVLTHTHSDHVADATLRWMARTRIILYCHEGHLPQLERRSGFQALTQARLVRTFDDRPFLPAPGLWAEAFSLKHSGPTFGFRFDGRTRRRGRSAALGYLTDTGSWSEQVADALTDVDLLGIEFNHDVELERNSGRAPALIARNLGPFGHLSNDQGADLLDSVVKRSGSGAVRQVVLLHLSEQCNRPDLALSAAKAQLQDIDHRATVYAARQGVPLPTIGVRPGRRSRAISIGGFPWES